MTTKKRVLVTGDFVLDHHIYEGVRRHYADLGNGVNEEVELGGAALIHEVLKPLLNAKKNPGVLALGTSYQHGADTAETSKVPDNCKAYAFWRPTPQNKDKKTPVWRVSTAMGFGGIFKKEDSTAWPEYPVQKNHFDVIVISDGGLGFRDQDGAWPIKALEKAQWIVLKTAAPLQKGPLWDKLSGDFRDKLIVVVSASDLRESSARISSGLSWEETLESLGREIVVGGALNGLASCRHLVVAFESEGALWVDLKGSPELTGDTLDTIECHFVYQAGSIEGDQRLSREGRAFGFLSCLAAAIVKPLVQGDPVDFTEALEGGLSAMHDLLENGHGPAHKEAAGFPAARLAGVIGDATCSYSRARLNLSSLCNEPTCPENGDAGAAEPGGCWSLLREALKSNNQACIEPAIDLAKLVIRHGSIAMESLPNLRIGGLMSVDRREIEALRVLEGLVHNYLKKDKADKPLSIGVFGPPGSGKSFTVMELAKKLLDKEDILEFNLSQFADPDDLIGAFHQIRDKALEGRVPVAFFDEFDSQNYNWLQYLLAPMQDGQFQEGQITHPIGQCVFIFAGGTSRSFQTFGPKKPDETPELTPQEREAHQAFVFAKGPDFKSRLDGFLNVNGPNRRHLPSVRTDTLDRCDIFFPLRRAFITRGNLRCSPHDKLNINPGLVSALVKVEAYRHGSRSLSKIVAPLKQVLPEPLYPSLVPPRGQLQLHTDADEFIRLCREGDRREVPPSFDTDPDRIMAATAIHDTWEELGVAQGWKTKAERVPYENLSKFYQDSNCAAADRMKHLLDLVDFKLVNGRNTEDQKLIIRNKIEYHLELLAEGEHTSWMDWYIAQGWQYGPKEKNIDYTKDPVIKTHPCLVPYAKLTDLERNKDRNSVRHFLDFAEAAGMKIVSVD